MNMLFLSRVRVRDNVALEAKDVVTLSECVE
jgi:hypothetical protein